MFETSIFFLGGGSDENVYGYEGLALYPNGDLSKKLVYEVKTGGPRITDRRDSGNVNPQNRIKYIVDYEFNARLTWRGEDKQTKEIRIRRG